MRRRFCLPRTTARSVAGRSSPVLVACDACKVMLRGIARITRCSAVSKRIAVASRLLEKRSLSNLGSSNARAGPRKNDTRKWDMLHKQVLALCTSRYVWIRSRIPPSTSHSRSKHMLCAQTLIEKRESYCLFINRGRQCGEKAAESQLGVGRNRPQQQFNFLCHVEPPASALDYFYCAFEIQAISFTEAERISSTLMKEAACAVILRFSKAARHLSRAPPHVPPLLHTCIYSNIL